MNFFFTISLLAAQCLGLFSLPTSPEEFQLDLIRQTIPGIYSNEKTLKKTEIPEGMEKNPMFQPQHIYVYPIRPDQVEKGAHWYYIGWFFPGMESNALDQALFQVYAENGVVRVGMYGIPNSHLFIREWEQKQPFATVDWSEIEQYRATTLEVTLLENAGVSLHSPLKQPFERHDPNALYRYVCFDMHFYAKKLLSNTKFLDADRKPLNLNPLELPFVKIKSQVR